MLTNLAALFAFQFMLFGSSEAGCGCSPCAPALPCAVPPPCPPPVICPPKICPPPPVCPVVIPKPCPPCIKPIVKPMPITIPKPVPEIIEQPMPVPVGVRPVVVNTCCSTCSDPCNLRKKRDVSNSTAIAGDPVCNNRMLKEVMDKKMTSDPTESQKLIVKEVNKQGLGNYNVLCATGDFSYAAYTGDFCQVAKDGVACYAFKNL